MPTSHPNHSAKYSGRIHKVRRTFRIKVIEPIRLVPPEDREQHVSVKMLFNGLSA
ncbi:MAG: hypothetical protein WCA79_05665 [Anaerolineales bacterium]